MRSSRPPAICSMYFRSRFISSPSGPRSSRRRRSSALSYLIQDAAREGESVKPAQVNQTLISGAVDVAEGLLLAAMCHDISNQSEVICVGHGFSPVRGLPPPASYFPFAFSPSSTSRRPPKRGWIFNANQCVYCFSPGGAAPGACSGNVCVSVGAAPLSSDATQSPAQSFVPLIVPTSLQPIGAFGAA